MRLVNHTHAGEMKTKTLLILVIGWIYVVHGMGIAETVTNSSTERAAVIGFLQLKSNLLVPVAKNTKFVPLRSGTIYPVIGQTDNGYLMVVESVDGINRPALVPFRDKMGNRTIDGNYLGIEIPVPGDFPLNTGVEFRVVGQASDTYTILYTDNGCNEQISVNKTNAVFQSYADKQSVLQEETRKRDAATQLRLEEELRQRIEAERLERLSMEQTRAEQIQRDNDRLKREEVEQQAALRQAKLQEEQEAERTRLVAEQAEKKQLRQQQEQQRKAQETEQICHEILVDKTTAVIAWGIGLIGLVVGIVIGAITRRTYGMESETTVNRNKIWWDTFIHWDSFTFCFDCKRFVKPKVEVSSGSYKTTSSGFGTILHNPYSGIDMVRYTSPTARYKSYTETNYKCPHCSNSFLIERWTGVFCLLAASLLVGVAFVGILWRGQASNSGDSSSFPFLPLWVYSVLLIEKATAVIFGLTLLVKWADASRIANESRVGWEDSLRILVVILCVIFIVVLGVLGIILAGH